MPLALPPRLQLKVTLARILVAERALRLHGTPGLVDQHVETHRARGVDSTGQRDVTLADGLGLPRRLGVLTTICEKSMSPLMVVPLFV